MQVTGYGFLSSSVFIREIRGQKTFFLRSMPRLPQLLLCLLLSPVVSAQEKVPQVLFLGDSVHGAIVQAAAKELGDKMRIHFPPVGSANDSGTALASIDELLGETPWDIIYFNFGIGDLFYKDPATREIRVMSKDGGGVRVSPPAQYGENLDALVQRLKATKAKLIWGTTTPMVTVHFFSSYQGNMFDENAELEYNAIAARVMAKHNVPVVDLHGHVMAQFKPGDKHPGYTQYSKEMETRGHPLHTPLVKALSSIIRAQP
jgi:lysophospholipase L1-like esterase